VAALPGGTLVVNFIDRKNMRRKNMLEEYAREEIKSRHTDDLILAVSLVVRIALTASSSLTGTADGS
jgi:hypothetical protein